MSNYLLSFTATYWTPSGWQLEQFEFCAPEHYLPPFLGRELNRAGEELRRGISTKLAALILGLPVREASGFKIEGVTDPRDERHKWLDHEASARIMNWHCSRNFVVVSGSELFVHREDMPKVLYTEKRGWLEPAILAEVGFARADYGDYAALNGAPAWADDSDYCIKAAPRTPKSVTIDLVEFFEEYKPEVTSGHIHLNAIAIYDLRSEYVQQQDPHTVWTFFRPHGENARIVSGVRSDEDFADGLVVTSCRWHFQEEITVDCDFILQGMTLQEFTERFRPLREESGSGNIPHFPEDHALVKGWKDNRVWSLLAQADSDDLWIVQGLRRNSYGHVLTELPWSDSTEYKIPCGKEALA